MDEEKVIQCSIIQPRKTVKIKKLKVDEVPEIEPPRGLTSAEKGFELEEILYKASFDIPGVTHSLRENDIKKYFTDTSLNGIDHWIQVGINHIFIQDKWKKSLNQREVSQFLNCVSRIQLLLAEEVKIHLLWVSKCAPTSNSLKMLIERKVHIIIQDSSTEDLAKLSIKKILDII
jgi:hypothetical protein